MDKKDFSDLKETLLKTEADRLDGAPSYTLDEAKQKLNSDKTKRLIKGETEMETEVKMIEKKSWQEFKDNGLLWWVNTLLHTFGYAIVFNVEEDGTILDVYPARVKFRGFDDKIITKGYQKISQYMLDNAEELKKESDE